MVYMLLLLLLGGNLNKGHVTSSGMTFTHDFMKICKLV